MPTLPWSLVHRLTDPPERVLVMASRFRIRRLRDLPAFFVDSLRIRRHVLATDGAVGVALVARPMHREFLTLSAWTDRASLGRFVRAQPHGSAMARHRPVMADSTFVFWETTPDQLPVPWVEVDQRLNAVAATSDRAARR